MTDPVTRRTLIRMTAAGAALGVAGALALAIARGPKWGLGFLIGTGFALFNLEWWKAIGRGLDGSGKLPALGSALLLSLRLPVVAGVLYVIVNLSGIASGAVIAGWLVSMAGIVLEATYEVVFAKR